MNEDLKDVPQALRPDRHTKTNTMVLHAIVSRLDDLLSKRHPENPEWRRAYATNVRDFLDLFDAKTPNLPCMCRYEQEND